MNIDTETLLKSGYRVGQAITDEQLHTLLLDSDNARRANEKALYLLEHRSHSKKELVEKISRHPAWEASGSGLPMEELGLVNDEEDARWYAHELLERKGLAKSRVSSCSEPVKGLTGNCRRTGGGIGRGRIRKKRSGKSSM